MPAHPAHPTGAARGVPHPALPAPAPSAAAFDGPRFGGAVADAWLGRHGAGRIDIPTGVVAVLALWPIRTLGAVHAPTLADFVSRQDAARWPATAGQIAAWHWMRRPDLIDTAHPLLGWADEAHNGATLRAVRDVAQAAIRHGIFTVAGEADPCLRSRADPLSWAITALRHGGDRSRLAEFHIPPHIADLTARMRLGHNPPAAGEVADLACGTGGMLRPLAQHLRENGVDPHRWRWHLQEKDPIAAAAAAVNTLLWDLGPQATVVCADSLQERSTRAQDAARPPGLDGHHGAVCTAARTIAGQLAVLRTLENPAPAR
ncbi:N-6 DNA methylase [Kitasatospora sp. NPDC088783]|uniref:N-6 DNA methylase n=1 Tax=Kitasatospora sp. NPDC088783 TaxID=3364077 RepID=UPI0037F88475